jgi:hypothetical protein
MNSVAERPAGRVLPSRERLSAVMAVILLAYVAVRFVQLPERTLAFQLFGVYLPVQFGINTLLAVLVAGLTASGADWLLRDHPALSTRATASHWLLPAMTAWVLSLLLSNLPFGLQWWGAFGLSALLLVAILIAEYNSVSAESRLYPAASLALGALSFGLFLILAISVRGLGLRLFLALPAIGLGAFLSGARVNLLRSAQDWRPLQLVGITFIAVQVAAALHYLPISALGYGWILLGMVFSLNNFAAALNSGQKLRAAVREPLVTLAIFWLLALLFH